MLTLFIAVTHLQNFDNWDNLITFFAFPDFIRKIIYTTNAIESLHSQFRKVTKAKLIFPTDDSLLKMLYLATENIAKRWTRTYSNWDKVISQLHIQFADVLDDRSDIILPSLYFVFLFLSFIA